ncbi:MAG: site-specific DNA-methyltransferase [Alphaproteobacteria bacterium]|nr:site-specific DNA-methyltransferase [Alphaproteobacteria bacterium]
MSGNTQKAPCSMDIAAEKREQLRLCLAAAFPEIMGEDKIDLDQLRRVLGEWVEPDRERFGLTWPGKAACMKVIQAPSVGTLKPCRKESVDWDTTENVFIEGDNLEVLKLLQKAYFGKIKVIYIDPPYNTGKEFIYPDKYAETLDTYLEYTGQKDNEGRRFSTNTDASGRFHSRWLNMMYPRLYLAKNLLRDDGAIFISIDDNERANLKLVCDMIFGEENFLSNIVWQKRYTRSNNTTDFTEVVEHVLVYGKSPAFSVNLLPRTEEADARYSNPDNDPRGVWKGASFLNPATPQERPNLAYPLVNPNTGESTLPTRSAWRRSKEAFDELQRDGKLYWGSDGKSPVPTIKMFLSEARGLTPVNFWEHEYAGHTDEGTRDLEKLIQGKVFDNPKPVRLLQRVLEHGGDDSGIILDFFAGSGVTAQAVFSQNIQDGGTRKFVLVQLPEPTENSDYPTIADIARERIRSASKQIAAEMEDRLDLDKAKKPDIGFRAFKLDRSNFRSWDGDVTEDEQLAAQLELHIDHVATESSAEDILYELLLKDGFPLAVPIKTLGLAGKEVFSIASGALLICLDKHLTQEVIDAMADLEPSRVICLDAGFQGNDQLKANAVQTFKARARNRETAIEFRTV